MPGRPRLKGRNETKRDRELETEWRTSYFTQRDVSFRKRDGYTLETVYMREKEKPYGALVCLDGYWLLAEYYETLLLARNACETFVDRHMAGQDRMSLGPIQRKRYLDPNPGIVPHSRRNCIMRFYVACLASYNNGVLHGAWIDATSDVDSMQEQIAKVLRESKFPNVTVTITCPHCHNLGETFPGVTCPKCNGACEIEVPSAEEWAIHDYDDMPSSLGEFPGLAEIAAYAELVEECEDHTKDEDEARALAKAMLENWHEVKYAKDALENFQGIHDSWKEYAEEQADEMIAGLTSGGAKIPEALTNYFDYDSWARDLKHQYTVLDLSNGVAVFSD